MRRTSLYRTTTLAILCFSLLLTLTDRMAVVPADYVPEPFRSQADYMPEVCRGFLHLQARAYLPCSLLYSLGVHLKKRLNIWEKLLALLKPHMAAISETLLPGS